MSFHATVHLSRPDALFIGGAWVAPATSARHTIISPFDGRTVIEIAEAKAEDVERAVAAAATAFENGPWPRMQLSERLAVLSRWADAIEARVGDIATAHSAQIGIPISFSTAVASSAVVSLRNTIEFAGAYRFEEDRPAQGGARAHQPGARRRRRRHRPVELPVASGDEQDGAGASGRLPSDRQAGPRGPARLPDLRRVRPAGRLSRGRAVSPAGRSGRSASTSLATRASTR